MYTIKLLSNQEYDNLPYRRAKTSLGCADAKKKVAFIRQTGVDIFDLGTIQHEIEELISKTSEHEFEGIRYKDKAPEYSPPPRPVYKTVSDLFNPATDWAKTNVPLAYGAREGALADILSGNKYYEGFQPTSFEQALGSQYFQNIMPDIERSISHQASMRGLEGTVVPIEAIAKQRGNLQATIGEYLSGLANTRATNSLTSRMGIDPYSTYQPYLQTDIGQSNTQTKSDIDYNQMIADLEYKKAMDAYKNKQSGISGMFGAGGAGIGALLAAALAIPTGGMSLAALPAMLGAAGAGASLGGTLGGSIAPIFGGSGGQTGGSGDIGGILSQLSSLLGNRTGITQSVGSSNIANNSYAMGGLPQLGGF